ncbi:hypothetical protein FM037_14700 [Shewanella psychropiezotolerans]|uniref:Uncharacterized protein n=1 Tax=Shewanella psychropiezotolerans TaxID=2593655 RepID=A0ABX5WYT4_9GAMM|nr:hypothetical protein [Shewanella sp. YLB-07]QDO84254.1 hypothetical protein FM037_14700 [Shewanella psychropiezotolerans]
MGAKSLRSHTESMEESKVATQMIDRLVNSGFLTSTLSQEGNAWLLAERKAYVVEQETSASVAIVLNVSIEMELDWINQASLALAACEEARDCGLQFRDNAWLLWRYYDENQDDELVYQGVVLQLAIARFLEKGLVKPLDRHRGSIIGRTA